MTSQRTRDRLVARLREQGIVNEQVLEVMADIPRHLFVDEALAHRAYEDTALPIGFNQTLSQPYTVAKMTELALEHDSLGRVLEIGSGSGYQSVVLAQFASEVFAIERIKPLLEKARQRLRSMRVRNIRCLHGDGFQGWAEFAPFDVILCAAAPEALPTDLLAQLSPDGFLLAPVGGSEQNLVRARLTDDGLQQEIVEPANFVPMVPGLQK